MKVQVTSAWNNRPHEAEAVHVLSPYMYGGGAPYGALERVQEEQRMANEAFGRLQTLLVAKGVLTLAEAVEVAAFPYPVEALALPVGAVRKAVGDGDGLL